MPLTHTTLPTDAEDGDPDHPEGHNTTNASINSLATYVAGLPEDADVASAVAAHSADTTSVHGITDTSALATTSAVAAGYQPLDADLTGLAGLGNGNPYRSAGAWAVRSDATLATALGVSGGGGTQVSVDGDDVATLDIDSAVVTPGDLGIRTVYSIAPPTGLTAIAADGTTDDAATLQAHLDYVSTTWGSGRVVVSKGTATVKLNSGITIPARVQLVSDETTLLDFSAVTSGVAITVNDVDFTPMIGVRLHGPNTAISLADPSIGIQVTGVRLRFYNTRIRYFGRGIDLATDGTWLVSFIGGDARNCGTCVYNANTEAEAEESGEGNILDHFTMFDSKLALHVTGNGVHFKVINSSIDFCARVGIFGDAWVHFNNVHIETQQGIPGGDTYDYMMYVEKNSKMFFTNTEILIGRGVAGTKHFIFDPTQGPWNYAFGYAQFSLCKVLFVGTDDVDYTYYSSQLVLIPAGETVVTHRTAFPLRWVALSAEPCVTDGGGLPAIDNTVRVSASDYTTGVVTLTAAASHGSDRWVRVKV